MLARAATGTRRFVVRRVTQNRDTTGRVFDTDAFIAGGGCSGWLRSWPRVRHRHADGPGDRPQGRWCTAVPALPALVEAMRTHRIVILSDVHNDGYEYQLLDTLIADPAVARGLTVIGLGWGNAAYQAGVDRYVAGNGMALPVTSTARSGSSLDLARGSGSSLSTRRPSMRSVTSTSRSRIVRRCASSSVSRRSPMGQSPSATRASTWAGRPASTTGSACGRRAPASRNPRRSWHRWESARRGAAVRRHDKPWSGGPVTERSACSGSRAPGGVDRADPRSDPAGRARARTHPAWRIGALSVGGHADRAAQRGGTVR